VNLRPAVVITGASSGIGAATAARFASAGYEVFGGVRNALDATKLEVLPGVHGLLLDVTDAAAIREASRTVAASGHPMRALVNNAGIAVAGPLEYLPIDDLRRQLEVNVAGALAVTQAFLPLLRSSRGRIVFLGSISGRLAVPYIAPYGASKAALRTLANALRVELGPTGVRVVLIEPGSVRTPIWRKGRDGMSELRRLIGPAGVAIYGHMIDAVARQTEREERAGMPVERVAEAILQAVEASRPQAERLIGLSAHAGSVVALLPAWIRDRVIARSSRLPNHR
jgi:NAD(P)-dependent dehydrogenase (short-subunit alcohol dehydrogenase family)